MQIYTHPVKALTSIQANNGTKETDNGLCHEHSSITVETHSTNRTRIQHAPLTEENTCTNEYIASQELPPNPRLPPKQVDKRVPQKYAGKVSQFPKYIEDITRLREDMDFMFEWQEQYLTSERSERVRYCSCHENIKSISLSCRVMFFSLYGRFECS